MLDILKSYLKEETYYIILMKKGLYIKNYSKLVGMNEEELLIEMEGKLYQVKGSHMTLTKTVGHELAISGSIESIQKL